MLLCALVSRPKTFSFRLFLFSASEAGVRVDQQGARVSSSMTEVDLLSANQVIDLMGLAEIQAVVKVDVVAKN